MNTSPALLSGSHRDRTAIALSALCAVHCFFLPLVLPVLPWLALIVEHESEVHRGLLIAIVPLSAYALIRGWQQHRRIRVLLLGAVALGLLMVTPFTEFPSHEWESVLTVLGSAALCMSHLLNLQNLRQGPASAVAAT